MADPVLSQLITVESDLAEQIEQIEAQLSQLHTKRQGLLTVIDLFDSSEADSSGEPPSKTARTATQTKASPAVAKLATKATKRKATRGKASSTSKASTQKASTTRTASTAKAATTKSTAGRAKPGRKPKQQTAGRKKKDGRAANWQKHVQTPYRELALPESVSSVLQSNPSEVFTIAEVMTAIFKENIPRTSYLKARNRISNILSAGARDGTWYRGRNGRYSQSESVTKIK